VYREIVTQVTPPPGATSPADGATSAALAFDNGPGGATAVLAADGAALAPAYLYPQPDRLSLFVTKVAQRSPAWLGPAVAAIGCGAACAFVLWRNPTAIGADELPTCLVRLTTGFDCPGCGGTRAAWYLMHGEIGAAARHHLLFVFAVPFIVYAYVAWAAGAIFKIRLPQLRLSFRTLGIGLLVWGVFTVLRNLPFAPFTWFYV